MEITREEAKKAWKLDQLQVNQNDGLVRTGRGQVVGKNKYVVNVDYSLDTKEAEEFIVNAISPSAAEDAVTELLNGIARRKGMELGAVFINFAVSREDING